MHEALENVNEGNNVGHLTATFPTDEGLPLDHSYYTKVIK